MVSNKTIFQINLPSDTSVIEESSINNQATLSINSDCLILRRSQDSLYNPGCPNLSGQIHHQNQCIEIQILESTEVKYNIEMDKSENLFMGSQYWGIKKISLRESHQKKTYSNNFFREVELIVFQDEELIDYEEQNHLNMSLEYDSDAEWIDMDISEIEKSLSYESN